MQPILLRLSTEDCHALVKVPATPSAMRDDVPRSLQVRKLLRRGKQCPFQRCWKQRFTEALNHLSLLAKPESTRDDSGFGFQGVKFQRFPNYLFHCPLELIPIDDHSSDCSEKIV
jgi:hypothetical protein